MSVLSHRIIKLLCGGAAFERGGELYRAGKVKLVNDPSEDNKYEAVVKGRDRICVSIQIDDDGDVQAECDCRAFYMSEQYCHHIAATLLCVYDLNDQEGHYDASRFSVSLLHGGPTGVMTERIRSRSDNTALSMGPAESRLSTGILELFEHKSSRTSMTGTYLDERESIDVEFTCRTVTHGNRRTMFGIEMKIGAKRLYVVPKIREFLDMFERGEAVWFSKHFTYDPKIHVFGQANDAVMKHLLLIHRNERMYKELTSGNAYSSYSSRTDERLLIVPPYAWNDLLPLLKVATSTRLTHENVTYPAIQETDEQLPVQFEFDRLSSDRYKLDVRGIEQVTLLELYETAIFDGRLLRMDADACSRLAEMKRMLDASRSEQVAISPGQMEAFMDKVVPGLMKLGTVRVSQEISDRITQAPLKASLYLDRVRDRLLAGLEFQYGDIVVNPLDAYGQKRSSDRILVRDGAREQAILQLMELASFTKTESGYFIDDEESEYEFMYRIVPQLEKLVSIYATSAAKERLYVKHAPPVISVDVDERTDWLDFRFDMDGISEANVREVLKALEEKRNYYKLPNGALMPLESEPFQALIRFMNEVGIRQLDMRGAGARLPAVRALRLLDAPQYGNAVKLGRSLRKLLDNMRNPDHLDFPVPERLQDVLRDYQKFGYQWMKTLAHYRFGGILADDMGLGKTLQSIAFLVSVLPDVRERQVPVLIVSPASLTYNWLNELAKFAPDIRAVVADGEKEERTAIIRQLSGDADVIITSYPLLRRDHELYAKQSYHTLILDEAQMFKNYTTQTAHVVKDIQATYRFALTGTPIENRLEEIWSIFDAVFPELFQNRKSFQELDRETVARRIRPFVLRRLKSDVLKELPEKIESIQSSELLPEQKKLYIAYLAKLQQETLKHLDKDTFQRNRIKILAGLTRLRQLCCHPALFVEQYSGGSSKFEQLMEIVEESRNAGKRMLVFSQFTEMLGLIGKELASREMPYFYLDGSTPSAERVELCRKYNEGERDLFLISLKAGGTGLNLTGADTVLLYDLWWNPAVEEQAADRAHRIGQRNVVQVIRLVARGTVEEKMYDLQQRKKHLIDEVIQPGQEALSALTEQDLREILMI